MKYKKLNGTTYEEDNRQDRLLRKLYTTFWGRCVLKILTRPGITKAAGAFLETSLSKVLIKPFIKRHHMDMTPYVTKDYVSYNDFFIRSIKPENRMIDYDETHLISPADGKVSVYDLEGTGSFWVKHSKYNLARLLRSKGLARKYRDSYAVIIRLTVDDYHRYCYPASGIKGENRSIRGIFHTVNPIACETIPVYHENSREYTIIRTKNFGDVLQMEVGALLVGRISNYLQKTSIKKGQEKGKFEFGGSTVILLLDKEKNQIRKELLTNTQEGYETIIHMGEWLSRKNT